MELILFHYYNLNVEPLKSISRTKDNLEQVYGVLKEQEGKSFNRFRNLGWYIEQRQQTEKWLLEEFLRIGGKPKVTTPIYFVLGNSSYLKECYGDHVGIVQIPLEDISKTDISFTLEDSMSLHISGNDKFVFSIETLLEYVEKQGMTIEDCLEEAEKKHKYIEVQIWNDKYFTNLFK